MAIKSKKRASDVDIEALKTRKTKITNEDELRDALKKRMKQDDFSEESAEESYDGGADYDDGSVIDPDEDSTSNLDEYGNSEVSDELDADNMEGLTRGQRKRLKKKLKKAERKAINAQKPKREPKPAQMTSTVALPENPLTIKDGPQLLEEIKARLTKRNDLSFQIKPIPKHVSPDIVADLCPSAMSFYHPVFRGANFGFVNFRNKTDMEQGRKELKRKSLQNKPIKIVACSSNNENVKKNSLDDFDLAKLVVMNLTRDANRFDLGQIFKTAVDVKFRQLTDGTCSGSCDLLFKSHEDAIKAFYECHQAKIRGIPIYVNFTPKGTLHKKKQEQESNEESGLVEAVKSKKLGFGSKLVDDPVASDSDEDLDQGMDVDEEEEDEFSIREQAAAKREKRGKQRLQGYQKRLKNSGLKTKVKKTNYKKR